MAFESVNPATGEKVRRYRAASGLEISEALDAATAAFHSWSRIAVSDRALHLHGAANVLRESKKKWALLMAEEMGKPVSQAAGEQLKKVVLELGGSDPYVILEDADLAQAAAGCAEGRLINAGQSCIAAKRMIVVGSAMERFRELLVREMSARRMGDPREESTHIGPLARADIRLAVASQVARSLSAGARCLLGGQSPEGPGFFYPPTVLVDVKPGMPAFDEEVFGPVAALIRAESQADAIRLANESSYGLGAAVYTTDLRTGERIAREDLMAGSCFVNAYVRSDPRLPFGGIRGSGVGRELSAFGIREFVNVKTVWVQDR